ncbi:MAG: diguanylate cyclase [Candidatus Neomarinimicrobiota bacterium]
MSDSLPGSSAAVYLHERDGSDLIFQKSNAPANTFVESIPSGSISDLTFKAGKDSPASARMVSDKSRALLLTSPGKHPDGVVIVCPLVNGDGQVGMLVVELQHVPNDELQVLRSIELVARIIQNNLIMKSQLELTRAEKAFLSDLVSRAVALDISSTVEVLIDTLVDLAKGMLTFDRLTISTQCTEVHERLKIDWVEGLEENYPVGFTYAPAGVVHGEVFRRVEALNIGCLEESEYQGRFLAGDFKSTRLTCFLGVPIVEAGISRGLVAVESTAKDHFGLRDLDILKAIVQVYGTALCWTQRYREIHAMATVDGLTQLLNHRSFMERLGQELERASRYGETMTFLMLDLDHFKNVNDSYGHLYGDYVLWQTAQLIRSCVRKADIAGRYGGEEFGVIIINAGKNTSLSTAERIRNTIADYQFTSNGIKSRISVSIGMSEYPTDGQDMGTLIQCADDAMYMVKRRGGNDVISYSGVEDKTDQEGQ